MPTRVSTLQDDIVARIDIESLSIERKRNSTRRNTVVVHEHRVLVEQPARNNSRRVRIIAHQQCAVIAASKATTASWQGLAHTVTVVLGDVSHVLLLVSWEGVGPSWVHAVLVDAVAALVEGVLSEAEVEVRVVVCAIEDEVGGVLALPPGVVGLDFLDDFVVLALDGDDGAVLFNATVPSDGCQRKRVGGGEVRRGGYTEGSEGQDRGVDVAGKHFDW